MTFDALEALAELVDVGLEGSCVLELATRTRGSEGPVDDDGEGNDPLRPVDAGHHL